jgi:magnesium and cobalt exporter, CNNM family
MLLADLLVSTNYFYLALLVCLVASAFYSGTETGLMSVSRIRLRFMELRDGNRKLGRLLNLLRHEEDPILTCLIGTNLFNVLASSILTAALILRLGEYGELAAAFILSVLVIIFGEILPKVLYREFPQRMTVASVPVLRLSMILLAPLRLVLLGYSQLLRLTLPASARRSGAMRREAVAAMLTRHQETIEDTGFRELTERCLELADLDTAVLTKRLPNVVMLSHGASLQECRTAFSASGFSRLPVYGEGLQDILGWVLARDLLFADTEHWQGVPEHLIREPVFVDTRISPWALFEELRWQRQQLAFMTDAEGEVIGIVTFEDLLEVLVGRIEDEFDRTLVRIPKAAT